MRDNICMLCGKICHPNQLYDLSFFRKSKSSTTVARMCSECSDTLDKRIIDILSKTDTMVSTMHDAGMTVDDILDLIKRPEQGECASKETPTDVVTKKVYTKEDVE